jgi:hypothetical protein
MQSPELVRLHLNTVDTTAVALAKRVDAAAARKRPRGCRATRVWVCVKARLREERNGIIAEASGFHNVDG